MSDNQDDGAPAWGGRRKDGAPYKQDNTREDGSYIVGKDRPPIASRFAPGDGRKRGRRSKGVKNVDTDFARELNRKMIIKENGVERRVSKGHAVDLRLIDNATRKGDNKAIEMIDQRRRRIAEAAEANVRSSHLSDQALLDGYLRELLKEKEEGAPLLSDPEPEGDSLSPARESDDG